MKLWCMRLAYFFAAVALLFVVFILVEHFRGEWALSARLKELTSKGEKLSVAELKPNRVPPDRNVFAELLALTNQLRISYTNLNIAPPSMRLTPAGRAVVTAKLDEWSSDGKTTNDWRKFGMVLEKERGTLTAIEAATRKPAYDSGFDYEKGFLDYQFNYASLLDVKKSCDALSASVLYALQQGNLDSAHKSLHALTTLIAIQTPEPLIICQMVRRRAGSMAFNATWQALQSDGWSDAQLASLKSAWQPCDFVKDMASSMEMEQAMSLDYFVQIRDSKKKMDFVIQEQLKNQETFDGAFGTLPTHGIILNWLHLPIWRVAWAAQDELASLERWQSIIEHEHQARTNGWVALAGRKAETSPYLGDLFESPKELGWFNRIKYLFTNKDIFSVGDTMIRRTLEIQTQQQMVLTALAIQRYQLRNGKLPSDLSALVPDYMATMPNDFMDGKNLKYKLSADGKEFVLYSVGEDGKDDGGDPTLQKEKKETGYRQFWDGRDAVWPSAATAEEAKLAMQPKKRE